jgi:DNA-binding response OmpR family regulator
MTIVEAKLLDSTKLRGLRVKLESEGNLESGQFEAAERFAEEKQWSVSKALVALQYVDPAVLGRSLSEIYHLPYFSLLNEAPPLKARRHLSNTCARHWKVIPVAYDSDEDRLTIAVHSMAQIRLMEKVNQLFMQSHDLQFCIASELELERAFDEHFTPGGGTSKPATALPSALSKDHQSEHRLPTRRVNVTSETPKAPAGDPAGSAVGTFDPFGYTDMSRALISAVAALAQSHLAGSNSRVIDVRERVRYTQLLASRLKLSPEECDAVIIASWLSAFDREVNAVLGQLATPFRLSEIFDQAAAAGQATRPEARILSLVRAYEALRHSTPGVELNTHQMRRQLERAWGSGADAQPVLETFLQILMDEDFLSRADSSAGRILVIDRSESSSPTLAAPLSTNGYEVHVVSTAETARLHISKAQVDLVICDIPLQDEDPIKLCREFGQNGSITQAQIVLTGKPGHETDIANALRAGAIDYVAKPYNMELFLLKIEHLMDRVSDKSGRTGVHGTLEDMSFSDLVQILCAGGKSGELRIVDDAREATVFIRSGHIIDVANGDLNGEEAFYDLMQWNAGEFSTQPCAQFPDRTIHAPAMSLLMEGARRHDESAAA